MKLFKIRGVIQNYDWGGSTFIPNLLGLEPTNDKCAEYWMGAHDKAPSIILESDEKLNDYINNKPEQVLGKAVYEKFGKLPFLFKVLDVSDMLSIQVHPSKTEAEKGFKKENELNIPLTASYRNYKDDNHKPEIMVALSEFWLLHGFKPENELIETLNNTPELQNLISVFKDGGYRELYEFVMKEEQSKTNAVLQPLIDRILPLYKENKLDKTTPEFWAAKAYLTFCPGGDLDKGIYSIYFFNIVKALPGEAVFQDAGIPHAYMEGQNMELMANSDNVLRGGLTPKHVDVDELLKHVAFEETIPNILTGDLQNQVERVFKSPAPDFELSSIKIDVNQNYTHASNTLEIIIALEGSVEIKDDKNTINLRKGEVIVIVANTNYIITNNTNDIAILYKAKCPVVD
ncbi:mannose-6-phosphate isomerase, class I [Aestuariibaculum sediminum]|uniref:mannose-6-phosphate isomerase n=1 Tax=Aestuariibaculum sediminum TaxID=2770637 RepID=A0A8J6QAQ3_9FLAO|nr:mannose-6-phosphate isomerase, class I [Aestuariibaculum sediminum]MBD0832191.1 mannose-6-phosphate isomerase, class I [Aestuariibaculum sediminum]